MDRELIKENLFLWGMSFKKIPLLFYCRPRIIESTALKATIRIPLRRRTKNHLNCMYFGALCAGADACGGFLASKLIRKSGHSINLLFKDLKADFLKRAEKDVYFVCHDGEKISRLIEKVIKTKERGNEAISVTAFVKDGETELPVAQFAMTLSLK
jgi:acyl-coenzyme A thioesterase PaaI-like protein